jgi:hypothetical protein
VFQILLANNELTTRVYARAHPRQI